MQVYISYDLDDGDKFDDLSEVFNQRRIAFFNPGSMRGNRLLADQLRESINLCWACVFVATHNSVNSAWCAAELGAFWGAGKDVILYIADGSLKEEQLPKQFAGWLRVRSIFKVADDIEAILDAAKQRDEKPIGPLIGSLSVETFIALIAETLEPLRRQSDLAQLIFQLGGDFDGDEDSERFKRLAGRGISRLLGEHLPKALEMKVQGWRYSFDAPTTTGVWIGYGQASEQHADGMLQIYKKCLLIRLDEQRTIVGAALTHSVSVAHKALGLNSWTLGVNVLAHAGQELGLAQHE